MSETKSQTMLNSAYMAVNHYMGMRNKPTQESADLEHAKTRALLRLGVYGTRHPAFEDSNLSTHSRERSGDMYGMCIVKDLSGNQHFACSAYNGRGQRHYHVEDWPQRDVNQFWKDKGKLTCAKVSFFFWESPCPKCTSKIPGWSRNITKLITGSDESRSVYFVFNFGKFYISNANDGRSAWTSENEAKAKFAEITSAGGLTSPITNANGTYTIPRISFRQSDFNAETNIYTFAGIAGKTKTG